MFSDDNHGSACVLRYPVKHYTASVAAEISIHHLVMEKATALAYSTAIVIEPTPTERIMKLLKPISAISRSAGRWSGKQPPGRKCADNDRPQQDRRQRVDFGAEAQADA